MEENLEYRPGSVKCELPKGRLSGCVIKALL